MRHRYLPWIHRYYRSITAGIASIGAVVTAYLTVVKFTLSNAACPTDGCDIVLSSPYASIFGLPLTLFGFLAYFAIVALAIAPLFLNNSKNQQLRASLERWTSLLIFAIATAMLVFSSYLMYLLFFVIKVICIYCIASAFFCASLFILSLFGRYWEDIGELLFRGTILAIVVLVGTIGVYGNVNDAYQINSRSNVDRVLLAKHLTQQGAKMYGAFWCSHCQNQKQLFGKEAFSQIDYIECDPRGKNPRPDLCQNSNIKAFPTWEINDKFYQRVITLPELADLSGYQPDLN